VVLIVCGYFGLVPKSDHPRKVVGHYRLEHILDKEEFYLFRNDNNESDRGRIAGNVLHIGWNERYIVFYRNSSYRVVANGWIIVDIKSDRIRGPLTDSELSLCPERVGMQIVDVKEAWANLK